MKLQKLFKRKKLRTLSDSTHSSISSSDLSTSSSSWSHSQSLEEKEGGSSGSRNSPTRAKFARKFGFLFKQAKGTSMASNSSSSSSIKERQDIVPSLHLTEELAEAFRFFDVNGDGKISPSELGSVLCSLGDKPSDKELEIMVKEADSNGDGFIDLKEFINLNAMALEANTGSDGGSSSVEVLKAAFQVFDADRNGFISADELHRVLSGLGEESLTMEDCRCMISSVDRDGDGCVDFQEFQWMMSGSLSAER